MRVIFLLLSLLLIDSKDKYYSLYSNNYSDIPIRSDSVFNKQTIVLLLNSIHCSSCVDDIGVVLCDSAFLNFKKVVLLNATLSSNNYWLNYNKFKKSISCISDLYFTYSVFDTQKSQSNIFKDYNISNSPAILIHTSKGIEVIKFDLLFPNSQLTPFCNQLIKNYLN